MLRFEKSYFAPNTFDSKADSQDEYECVEMDSRLPLFAASVQLEDGSIRWLLVARPDLLALAHRNLAKGIKALAVYQLNPDFEDGIELGIGRVTGWDFLITIAIEEQSASDAYRLTSKRLISFE